MKPEIQRPIPLPSHAMLFLIKGNTSLYVMQLMFPINKNCLLASKIQAKNSRKSEKGGFVITKSASSRKALTSLLLKSPSPSKYCHSRSSISINPEWFLSLVRVKILPWVFVLLSSNWGASSSNNESWYAPLKFLLSWAKLVLISFFSPKFSKFCAKNLVKFDHSGSSQGRSTVLPLNTSGLYSR